jgi:hypothetical protein
MQVWTTFLKVNPYQKKEADAFDAVNLSAILDLPWRNHMELRALVFVAVTCFTGIRGEDLSSAKTSDWTCLLPTPTTNRAYQLIMKQTKNDKQGTGPVSGRTFCVGCICLQNCRVFTRTNFCVTIPKFYITDAH